MTTLPDERENPLVLDRAVFDGMGLPSLTLAELIRHAERFGSEGVYETAEVYLSGTELSQLNAELARIDEARRRQFQDVPKRKRMSRERKLRTVAFLAAEGLPNDRIAKQLGLSPRTVEGMRAEARRVFGDSNAQAPSDYVEMAA